MTLNPKQQRFVQEYLVDLNATQAAIRAGYSAKTAYSQGQRLLKHVEVQRELAEGQQRIAEKVEIDAEWVRERLVRVVERCLQTEPVFDRKGNHAYTETPDGEDAKAYTFDAKGANGALGLLARHLGMLKDNLNVNVHEDWLKKLADG